MALQARSEEPGAGAKHRQRGYPAQLDAGRPGGWASARMRAKHHVELLRVEALEVRDAVII
jgi:hypothetical protein